MGRGCLPPLSRDAVLIHAGAPADAGARSIQPYRSQLWVGTLPLRGFARRSAARPGSDPGEQARHRSEEHTSELQSLMRISYAVFCLKKKKKMNIQQINLNK